MMQTCKLPSTSTILLQSVHHLLAMAANLLSESSPEKMTSPVFLPEPSPPALSLPAAPPLPPPPPLPAPPLSPFSEMNPPWLSKKPLPSGETTKTPLTKPYAFSASQLTCDALRPHVRLLEAARPQARERDLLRRGQVHVGAAEQDLVRAQAPVHDLAAHWDRVGVAC